MKILLFIITFLFFLPLLAIADNKISVITIDDKIINPVAAEYIEGAIDRAEREQHQALIIQLDTPGGLLSSTRVIVKRILNAAVPVVVYIAPSGSRAGSAGVFITQAAHLAAMAPSTNIGAAHPVEFGESPKKEKESFRDFFKSIQKGKPSPPAGEGTPERAKRVEGAGEGEKDPMAEKILNDTIAWISTITKTRGRNVDWAVKAVRESISDGETKALQLGVIDYLAQDLPELLRKIDGKKITLASGKRVVLQTTGAPIVRFGMSLRQRILDVLINPNIAYILMMLGFYGLLFEITHPGVWFPGVAGLICIILAFYAFHTLPTNYAGLALILLAMALFIAEVFVTSYGLLTLVGVVSMLLGSLFLVDSAAQFMQISLKVIIPIVVATGGLCFFLITLAVRAQRQVSPVGAEALVGAIGEIEGGKVYLKGELWDAISIEPLHPGDKVQVVAVEALKLRVRKVA